jgi:hypothetical protein
VSGHIRERALGWSRLEPGIKGVRILRICPELEVLTKI